MYRGNATLIRPGMLIVLTSTSFVFAIRKHPNDVMRLSQLPAPESRIPVAAVIGDDLCRFLDAISADRSVDPKSLKLNNTVTEIVERIGLAFELPRSEAR